MSWFHFLILSGIIKNILIHRNYSLIGAPPLIARLYFFHTFIVGLLWQIQRSQWAMQAGWVGQFTRRGGRYINNLKNSLKVNTLAFLKKYTLFIDQKCTSWKRAKKFFQNAKVAKFELFLGCLYSVLHSPHPTCLQKLSLYCDKHFDFICSQKTLPPTFQKTYSLFLTTFWIP